MSDMRRREFIVVLGGAAAAWPLAARAQQPARPAIGFLHSASASTFGHAVTAAGFAEQRVDAVVAAADVQFTVHRTQFAALALRHRLPTSFHAREIVQAGGLMSYGPSQRDAYRLAGLYAGRILKGDKPADLPVQQATTFEFVLNVKTAKALGLKIPPTVLALADEVIE
jgi:putative tryptophan/tyrosine transport system substrate-binding protein